LNLNWEGAEPDRGTLTVVRTYHVKRFCDSDERRKVDEPVEGVNRVGHRHGDVLVRRRLSVVNVHIDDRGVVRVGYSCARIGYDRAA
jgi:hypothetical protein